MIEELKLRYERFVNRNGEIKRFCDVLEKDEYFVLLVSGESGMGKTALHKRLLYECEEMRKIRWAETYWLNTRTYNYLAILRKIRDDIGEIHFQHFTDLLNFFTKSSYELTLNVKNAGSIQVGNEMKVDHSEIENMIGQQIIIKDLNLNEPREDRTIREQERMYKITQEFISDLEKALNGSKLVIFVDDVEKMTPETGLWLWSEFIRGLMLKGLTNVRFVLCIDNAPQLEEDVGRRVRVGKLQNLKEEYVLDYLKRLQVGETDDIRKALAEMIFAQTNGKPSAVAGAVQLFKEFRENKAEAAEDE
jgi:predicted ATPase